MSIRVMEKTPPSVPMTSPVVPMTSKWLAEQFPPMDEEMEDERMEVVADLQDVIGEWFESLDFLGKKVRGVDEFILRLSGSFRIGVSSKDGDIDIVFIAPQYVQHDLFFESLGPFLEKSDVIDEVIPIPYTRVPIFGLKIRDVEIDLLLASLPVPHVPKDFNLATSRTIALSRATVDSINGPRVTQYVLNKIHHNKITFAIFLKAIRGWSKARGIYGAKMGFLGGIQWSMLALFIFTQVKDEVRRSPSKLLKTFFHVFAKWNWKHKVVSFPEEDTYRSPMKGWEPSERKSQESMVVLTPMNPRINCTFNVNPNTLVRIQEELTRAAKVTSWAELYEPYSIRKHKLFLILGTKDADEETQGFIESKVRFLPLYIFMAHQKVMGQVVLLPKAIKEEGQRYFVIGITIDKEKEHYLLERRDKYDERAPKKTFNIEGDWSKFIYECKMPTDKIYLKSIRKSQLSADLFD